MNFFVSSFFEFQLQIVISNIYLLYKLFVTNILCNVFCEKEFRNYFTDFVNKQREVNQFIDNFCSFFQKEREKSFIY